MSRVFAVLWAAVVLLAGGYLGVQMRSGLPLRTDLLALLPREERDPVLQRANEEVSRNLSRRIVVMVGGPDREAARAASAEMTADLAASGVVKFVTDALSADRLKQIGQALFPFRHGLLSRADRAALQSGHGGDIAERAVAQAFGIGGLADARLLKSDPFLLFPAFLSDLPTPLSKLTLEDGMLSVNDQGVTWVALIGSLVGEPFALDVQEKLVQAFELSSKQVENKYSGVKIMRLGAPFFAREGSSRALTEAASLSTASILGTMLLVLIVFRRIGPLLMNMLIILVGVGVGLAFNLLFFGGVHVAALLFGTSLIGMAVDYGLLYTTMIFDPNGATPARRLRLALPGMTLGLITTLLGYGALMLAPFPGLRQIAVFSVVGMAAAYLTVVLWAPLIDHGRPQRIGDKIARAVEQATRLWNDGRFGGARIALLALASALALLGLSALKIDDDVRRLQTLSPELAQEQEIIRKLIGVTAASQFLLVEAPDDEAALQREETLEPALARLVAEGAVASIQSPASFAPSAARQKENASLRRNALEIPYGASHLAALGLPAQPLGALTEDPGALSVDSQAARVGFPLLGELVLAPGLHAIALQGLVRPADVRAAVRGKPGVRFVDPTADFSTLLGKYRVRAISLIAVSALAMWLCLAYRYGLIGSLWVMAPATIVMVLTPAVLGLMGQTYTFFHAMAQAILLAIATDYAIFCAEGRHCAALLSVWLAGFATLLSFGLLALSGAPAVQGFGLTMLIGIALAVGLAPLANRARDRRPIAQTSDAERR